MFKSKTLMMLVTLLILLAATLAIALPNGSAKFNVLSTLFVAGNEIKPGQYDVKWDFISPQATVTFTTNGIVAAKVRGKIMEVDKKYEYDSCITGKDSSGRVVIKELQFRGKNIRIVFE
jgi:aspartate carbamoyltransferase regulatory subunit